MQKLSSSRRVIAKTLFAAALVGLSGPIALAQPTIRSVGAMQDVNKVSVRFNGPIDPASIATGNFSVSAATVTNAEMQLTQPSCKTTTTAAMTVVAIPQITAAATLP